MRAFENCDDADKLERGRRVINLYAARVNHERGYAA